LYTRVADIHYPISNLLSSVIVCCHFYLLSYQTSIRNKSAALKAVDDVEFQGGRETLIGAALRHAYTVFDAARWNDEIIPKVRWPLWYHLDFVVLLLFVGTLQIAIRQSSPSAIDWTERADP
jgi:hypothetical protein